MKIDYQHLLNAIAEKKEDLLREDYGYGYGGEVYSTTEIDEYALAQFIIEYIEKYL